MESIRNGEELETYDAADNRNSNGCTFNALNEQRECLGYYYWYDALGNRTSRQSKTTGTVQTYGWDELNRLIDFNSTWSYTYRSDGLRTKKYKNGSNYSNFRYDGQMPIQEEAKTAGTLTTTDSSLGARGVDAMLSYNSSGTLTATAFPIYDSHGNQAASLARSGSSYSLSGQRTYDCWGVIRTGGATGASNRRYCANLGHVQDDETDLIYMRARYYDFARGRFISQDPGRHGTNWYAHCSDDPVNRVDPTGRWDIWATIGIIAMVADIFSLIACCVIEAPAALIVITIVLTIIVLLDAKHTIESVTDAVNHGVFQPYFKRMQEAGEEGALGMINDVKTNGSVFDKLIACDLEDCLYLADAED